MYESLKERKRKAKAEFINEIGIPVTLVIAISIGGIAMISCSLKKQEKEKANIPADNVITRTDLQNEINGNVNSDSTKIFNEGEHILSVRVKYEKNKNDVLAGYAINNIPEGYEIFEITPYIVDVGYEYGSATTGYDIWFKNTEKVEVEASYNEVFKQYGYYTFGKLVEDEKVLEK